MHEAQEADSASGKEQSPEESDLEKTNRCLATIQALLREAASSTFCTSALDKIWLKFDIPTVQEALKRINEISSSR